MKKTIAWSNKREQLLSSLRKMYADISPQLNEQKRGQIDSQIIEESLQNQEEFMSRLARYRPIQHNKLSVER